MIPPHLVKNMQNFPPLGSQPPPSQPLQQQGFGMRGPPPMHPMQRPPPMTPHFPQNVQNLQNSVSQFNQRLVEEIQQNHPMLSFNRINQHQPLYHQLAQQQQQQQMQQQHTGGNYHHYNNGNHHYSNNHQGGSGGNNERFRTKQQQLMANGILKTEPQDPYANLMSNRDKQWLISIQLMQLHTDTPYFDDYYFTVFKEREAKRENRAHTSNILNHPFTQAPKDHAHNMLMLSLANKNGLLNNGRNGTYNRERRNSESTNKTGSGSTVEGGKENKEQQGKTHYTPLQFENSLGKLQVGVSVTSFCTCSVLFH